MDLIDKNLFFIKLVVGNLLAYVLALLYTYNRSFLVHQETIKRIIQWNNREGIFCSEVHVGNDGTTIHFQSIAKEVGTAGPINPLPITPAPDFFTFVHNSSFCFTFVLVLIVGLVIGSLFYYLFFKNHKRENRETKDKEDGKSGGGDKEKD